MVTQGDDLFFHRQSCCYDSYGTIRIYPCGAKISCKAVMTHCQHEEMKYGRMDLPTLVVEECQIKPKFFIGGF